MEFLQYRQSLIRDIPPSLLERLEQYAEVFDVGSWQIPAHIELIREQPAIWWVPDFLTDEECAHLKTIARDQLEPSRVVDNATGDPTVKQYRTSRHMFLPLHHDAVVARIEAKIACLLQIPFEYGDGLQILNYLPGQEYKPHHDYFYPDKPSGQKALQISGQRVLTLLMYLNTVEQGGETAFPELGISLPPKQGHALLFGNLYPDGTPDPETLHASLPVIAGEKWVATKWIHELSYLHSLGLLKSE